MRIEPTELETQTAIMHLLAAEKIFALRINTSSQVLTDANGRKRVLKSHSGGAGVADILVLLERVCGGMRMGFGVIWLEIKSAKGKQSPEQMAFQRRMEELGHRYLVARSVEDVLAFLKEHQ